LTLEDKLRTYREKTARIAILELEIQGLEAEIKLSAGIQETDDETISGMALRRSLEGAGANDNTSKTERVAINYKAEQSKLSKPQSVSYLYEQMRDKQGELKRLKEETEPIRIALAGLRDKERLVIMEHCVNGNSLYTVSVKLQQAYGYIVNRKTCERIKANALKTLQRILGT
jgi:hypothetical protein